MRGSLHIHNPRTSGSHGICLSNDILIALIISQGLLCLEVLRKQLHALIYNVVSSYTGSVKSTGDRQDIYASYYRIILCVIENLDLFVFCCVFDLCGVVLIGRG